MKIINKETLSWAYPKMYDADILYIDAIDFDSITKYKKDIDWTYSVDIRLFDLESGSYWTKMLFNTEEELLFIAAYPMFQFIGVVSDSIIAERKKAEAKANREKFMNSLSEKDRLMNMYE